MGSYSPNENLTLTLQEIEEYQGQGSGKPSGKYLRYFCPIHGGDNQRSLSLDPETGRFQCYSCGAWGYLREKRQEWRQANQSGSPRNASSSTGRSNNPTPPIQAPSTPSLSGAVDEPPARPDLIEPLQKFQEALPGSPGEEYLKQRGISLEVAQKYGLGYAAPGLWPNPKKYFQHGCIVFPHTNPDGEVVNLYGRAADLDGSVPKQYRHAHLEGPKGVFHAQALTKEKVFITEGSFDALSLLAAGHEACAIFGVNGLRWPWVKARLVVFGFDQDEAGDVWRDLAYQGTVLGKDVYFLPKETYANNKDLNAAWAATGQLDIGEWTETKPESSVDIGSQPHEGTDTEIQSAPSLDDHGMSVLWNQMLEGSLKEPKLVTILPKFQGILGERVWFLPAGALSDTGRPELLFYREELIEIVPLLIDSPEYASILVTAKQVFGGVLTDSSEEEATGLNLDPNHTDSEHQIPQQGDEYQKVNKTQENGIPPEGVYQVKIEQVRARLKNFGDYAGPQARMEMNIIEGPEAGKTLLDSIALPHPLETEGRRKRRVRIGLRLGLISKEDFGKEEVKVNWKLLTGTCCSVEVVHKTYNGRVFPMVNNYQLPQQQ
jgi:hypothetical protein